MLLIFEPRISTACSFIVNVDSSIIVNRSSKTQTDRDAELAPVAPAVFRIFSIHELSCWPAGGLLVWLGLQRTNDQ